MSAGLPAAGSEPRAASQPAGGRRVFRASSSNARFRVAGAPGAQLREGHPPPARAFDSHVLPRPSSPQSDRAQGRPGSRAWLQAPAESEARASQAPRRARTRPPPRQRNERPCRNRLGSACVRSDLDAQATRARRHRARGRRFAALDGSSITAIPALTPRGRPGRRAWRVPRGHARQGEREQQESGADKPPASLSRPTTCGTSSHTARARRPPATRGQTRWCAQGCQPAPDGEQPARTAARIADRPGGEESRRHPADCHLGVVTVGHRGLKRP